VTLGGSIVYGLGKAQIGTSSTDVQDASTFGWTMSCRHHIDPGGILLEAFHRFSKAVYCFLRGH